MFSANRDRIIHGTKGREAIRISYDPPPGTIYAFDFGIIIVDEVHEARTRKRLWESIFALSMRSLIKVYMTATPLMESADVSFGPTSTRKTRQVIEHVSGL